MLLWNGQGGRKVWGDLGMRRKVAHGGAVNGRKQGDEEK